LEPLVGTPIVARAEAEAARLGRRAKAQQRQEPFERHLADAYAVLLSGSGKGRARRPELVVLVSHEVVKRGWTDVRDGEVCKILGVGPVSPEFAREIAQDAFLSRVFFDGKDLRNFARWTRTIPIEVLIALELGEPPAFDGVYCTDCGNRFKTEIRSRHTARSAGAKLQPQPQAPLLEVPPGQDQAGSQRGEAPAAGTVTAAPSEMCEHNPVTGQAKGRNALTPSYCEPVLKVEVKLLPSFPTRSDTGRTVIV
jgi:hypothetical protein